MVVIAVGWEILFINELRKIPIRKAFDSV